VVARHCGWRSTMPSHVIKDGTHRASVRRLSGPVDCWRTEAGVHRSIRGASDPRLAKGGPVRSDPRDVSPHERGAVDPSRREPRLVHAADGKQVFWVDGEVDQRVDDAAMRERREARLSRSRSVRLRPPKEVSPLRSLPRRLRPRDPHRASLCPRCQWRAAGEQQHRENRRRGHGRYKARAHRG
jgi:hypothetical protein